MALQEFEGEVNAETFSAYLIDCHPDDEEGVWIAKMMMHNIEEFPKKVKTVNGEIELDWIRFEISDKIAAKKGLI